MDELIKKYHAGTLSSDELHRLRDGIASMSREELIELLMANPAASNTLSADEISDQMLDRMKQQIDSQLRPASTGTLNRWHKAIMTAAAILIPVLMFSTVYLYNQIPEDPNFPNEILVTTAKGERTTVTLPDGTVAQLNGSSSIEFPSKFTDGYRNVKFNGEAFFDVAKSENYPFDITTPDMTVEVRGTSFNLLARTGKPTASLTLESGSVHLRANGSKRSIDLTPGHTATLNAAKGVFTVDTACTDMRPAWTRNEIILQDVSPDSLIRCLEDIYDVNFNAGIATAMDDTFTGTLPTNDLFGTLDILSRIYGFDLPYRTRRDISAYLK